MCSLEATDHISSKPSLLTLPNELLLEMPRYLEGFRDINSLFRTSRLFYTLFHTLIYRRAIVRDDIILWVLSNYRIATLMHLLDNGLSPIHEFWMGGNLLGRLCELPDEERSVPLVRLLLERCADMGATDATNLFTRLLHTAVMRGRCGIVALLLAHGADVNGASRGTPLNDAVFYGYLDIATLLVEHGADVNVVDTLLGFTPLLLATLHDYCDITALLLAHNAAVDARRRDGMTPLLQALKKGNKKVIPLLLAHGADVDARDNRGRTVFHWVAADFCRREHTLAKLLLEYGADVNAIDFDGRTPLHSLSEMFLRRRTVYGGSFCWRMGLILMRCRIRAEAHCRKFFLTFHVLRRMETRWPRF
jgi:hypothetical protein